MKMIEACLFLYHPHSNLPEEGKVVPLCSTEALLGDRWYSFYSFLTSALEGGEWSASCPDRSLPLGKEPPVPIVQEDRWAPELVWMQRLEKKSSASVGNRTLAVQSIVWYYTDCSTPRVIMTSKFHQFKELNHNTKHMCLTQHTMTKQKVQLKSPGNEVSE
jgi:hypothetical protein